MSDEKPVRARSENWTTEMKECLKDAVSPKIDIIDSKQKCSKFIGLKNEAWIKIQQEMEAHGFNIPKERLKQQWNRMKMKARLSLSNYKRQCNMTGGGGHPKSPSELDQSIASLTPMDFEDDQAMFDSDSILTQHDQQKTEEKQKTESEKENIVANDQQYTTKPNKKRRHANPKTGEEVLLNRTKQIKCATEHENELFKLKIEFESLKLQHAKELHTKDVEIRNKELELIELKIRQIK